MQRGLRTCKYLSFPLVLVVTHGRKSHSCTQKQLVRPKATRAHKSHSCTQKKKQFIIILMTIVVINIIINLRIINIIAIIIIFITIWLNFEILYA